MGKIGSYEYPETKVGECLRVAKILVKEFGKKADNPDAFASGIGHKTANSGAFLFKIGDVRKFNLMDKREYKATNLAEILSDPKNGAEENEALKKMIFGVSLFKILYDKLRTTSPTVEQTRTQLMEITGDRNKSSKEAEKIRKIYISAMTYIRDEFVNKQSNDLEDEMELEETLTSEGMMLFRFGKEKLQLTKNDTNIEAIISVLKDLKKIKGK